MPSVNDKETLRRLKRMGLTTDGAEKWLADFRIGDAPLVASTKVYDARTERVRMGRFIVEAPRPTTTRNRRAR